MLPGPVREPLLLGFMLAGLGTSTVHALPIDVVARAQHPVEQTTAGAPLALADTAGPPIAELRRLSGLTWSQLAGLFKVGRRSLHFWASGKPMTPSKQEHLQRLLGVLRKVDRGSASANRAALLAVQPDGTHCIDLLADADYERVLMILGSGGTKRAVAPKLSPEAWATRAPTPPGDLAEALHDRVHRESGIVRPAKSVRVRSGR